MASHAVRARPVHDHRRHRRRKIVQRPYSVASPRALPASGYEFYIRLVDGGTFTPLLWHLPVGHRMRMIGPKGKFTLAARRRREATCSSARHRQRPVHLDDAQAIGARAARAGRSSSTACSYERTSAIGRSSRTGQTTARYPVTYIPTMSRPDDERNAGWTGRTGASRPSSGRSSTSSGLTPANYGRLHVRQPGHDPVRGGDPPRARLPEEPVHKELYWPKGKEPRGARRRRPAPAIDAAEANRRPVAESLNTNHASLLRRRCGRQRCTRAPAPLTRARTSANVAEEVSPGVVIARAP